MKEFAWIRIIKSDHRVSFAVAGTFLKTVNQLFTFLHKLHFILTNWAFKNIISINYDRLYLTIETGSNTWQYPFEFLLKL